MIFNYFCSQDCCKNIPYFDNMINVFLKVLNIIDPVFSPDHDALVSIV